jgi:hypothetical protein
MHSHFSKGFILRPSGHAHRCLSGRSKVKKSLLHERGFLFILLLLFLSPQSCSSMTLSLDLRKYSSEQGFIEEEFEWVHTLCVISDSIWIESVSCRFVKLNEQSNICPPTSSSDYPVFLRRRQRKSSTIFSRFIWLKAIKWNW